MWLIQIEMGYVFKMHSKFKYLVHTKLKLSQQFHTDFILKGCFDIVRLKHIY